MMDPDYGRDGYVLVPTDLAYGWNLEMERRIDGLSAPGNNLLAEIPELMKLFEDEHVRSTLDDILGPRWLLEPHRYAHIVQPGWYGTDLHHDEFFGRSFDIRPPGMPAVIVLYYPHDVGPEDGPTVVVPGSHLRIDEWPDRGEWPSNPEEATPLLVDAGMVVVMNFALVHGSLQNRRYRRRQMVKFLVSGMRSAPFDLDQTLSDLGDDDPNVRARSLLELARNVEFLDPYLMDRVTPLLGDQDRYVQAYAAETLRRSDDPAALHALLEWMWPRRWDPHTTLESPF